MGILLQSAAEARAWVVKRALLAVLLGFCTTFTMAPKAVEGQQHRLPHLGGQMAPEDIAAEIVKCAHTLRATATAASEYLGVPIECPALGSASAFTPLLAWAFFNPFGPTICAVHLIDVPKTRERIIFFRSLNPFSTRATAYALLPETVTQDRQRLFSILMHLFGRRNSEQPTPMPSVPTHVQILPDSPLSSGQIKELVLIAAKSTDSKTLSVAIQRLRTYKGDPWKRTAVERDDAFEHLNKGTSPSSRAPIVPPTEVQLEEWWTLVTDPVHVQSEVRELPRAWDGAIEFQKRMQQR